MAAVTAMPNSRHRRAGFRVVTTGAIQPGHQPPISRGSNGDLDLLPAGIEIGRQLQRVGLGDATQHGAHRRIGRRRTLRPCPVLDHDRLGRECAVEIEIELHRRDQLARPPPASGSSTCRYMILDRAGQRIAPRQRQLAPRCRAPSRARPSPKSARPPWRRGPAAPCWQGAAAGEPGLPPSSLLMSATLNSRCSPASPACCPAPRPGPRRRAWRAGRPPSCRRAWPGPACPPAWAGRASSPGRPACPGRAPSGRASVQLLRVGLRDRLRIGLGRLDLLGLGLGRLRLGRLDLGHGLRRLGLGRLGLGGLRGRRIGCLRRLRRRRRLELGLLLGLVGGRVGGRATASRLTVSTGVSCTGVASATLSARVCGLLLRLGRLLALGEGVELLLGQRCRPAGSPPPAGALPRAGRTAPLPGAGRASPPRREARSPSRSSLLRVGDQRDLLEAGAGDPAHHLHPPGRN